VNTDTAAMRALAERRAAAVQDWLHGKLDDKRIAIKPPRLDAKGIDDKGKSTRADFGLH
jgi:outer membrane protein OmpA-like peptidoglycan-associated protein